MTITERTPAPEPSALAVPDVVRPFAGRITDVDTHEMLPAELWADAFGDVAAEVAQLFIDGAAASGHHYWSIPGLVADESPVDPATVWTTKGPPAPGAIDPRRRRAVMDVTGVRRQLMFPSSVAHCGGFIATYPKGSGFFERVGGDRRAYAHRLFAANNEWALGHLDPHDRVRPVLVAYGDTVADLLAVTTRLVERGARAVVVLSSQLPGGVSPAHPDLDPFYELLADAGVPLCLHIGGEGGFLRTDEWRRAPAFDGYRVSGEFQGDPWTRATIHLAPQNFTMTLIVGGVFDRHPALRFGVIEIGAHWVGPLAELLDLWADNTKAFSSSGEHPVMQLQRRPSEYLTTNVRVTPFVFEPVHRYVERYGLDDVYCYSSDYPHVEGGTDPMGVFSARLAPLGASVLEKFFVTNGELLLA
jgi:predicted TIM-barrel fold metal-dependent hydrolase